MDHGFDEGLDAGDVQQVVDEIRPQQVRFIPHHVHAHYDAVDQILLHQVLVPHEATDAGIIQRPVGIAVPRYQLINDPNRAVDILDPGGGATLRENVIDGFSQVSQRRRLVDVKVERRAGFRD